ncbi:MAG: Asp-tRNA(Asn)/Glu-tRNA(Gln) amidotransferase subunit GatC [Bdellovibrio sp. CG10_big_fil_rev_8_21_14_0_10_47_8]|nr:MAG: Asp-tRNA(Asn)/Glu-tRNA(Gln) amidotransferase subunit GatC [Bdellovibrio sp. CG10_big_fil_rev_8_21_14_0_10_47_8]
MIDQKTVQHIATLARLYVTESEAQEYSRQLSKILGYFEQISQVNTQGVEPLVTPTEIECFWREDVVQKELSAEEIVANAPEKTGHLFTVPPVV